MVLLLWLAVTPRSRAAEPAPLPRVRADRDRRQLPGRLSGRGRRRQRRREARHRRRRRRDLRLVREPDVEEADRHDPQADARHHQQRHGRPRRRRQGRDRHRLRVRDERADARGSSCWRSRARAWTIPGRSRRVADLGSIHRLRWGDVDRQARVSMRSFRQELELVVAPIFGPSAKPPAFDQEPAHLVVFDPGSDPKSGRWSPTIIGDVPVLHAIEVIDFDGNGRSDVLGASNLGVTRIHRGRGRRSDAGRFRPKPSPRVHRATPRRRGRARSTSAGSRTAAGSSPRSSPGTAPTSPSTCPNR